MGLSERRCHLVVSKQNKKGKKNQSRNGNYLLTALKLNLVMTVALKIGWRNGGALDQLTAEVKARPIKLTVCRARIFQLKSVFNVTWHTAEEIHRAISSTQITVFPNHVTVVEHEVY